MKKRNKEFEDFILDQLFMLFMGDKGVLDWEYTRDAFGIIEFKMRLYEK